MNFVFSVQGEGRGHMTQAISLYEMLVANGHTVSAVILGSSGKRTKPDFFYKKVKTRIVEVETPNFVTDKDNKSIKVFKSVIHGLRHIDTYKRSFRSIDETITELKPDVVINFFELLTGYYFYKKKPAVKHICIAHQYIYLHKKFEFPKGFLGDRVALKFFTRITSCRADKKLAISFYDLPEQFDSVKIVPPLLRRELFDLKSETQDYILVYLVNNGYARELANWHREHEKVVLHCFTDTITARDIEYGHPNFNIHQINDKEFLDKMASARGLATTAGFESVCEAMYLGKPVLMVPIQGHFEQYCNSRDAYKAGAGVYDTTFNVSRLIHVAPNFMEHTNQRFKEWVNKSEAMIYNELISA